MKASVLKRIKRREIHSENSSKLPPQTHRIDGWPALVLYTGFSRDMLTKWIKLEGFPRPEFHYRKKSDKLRANVWRRCGMWDKRKIGDWFIKRADYIKEYKYNGNNSSITSHAVSKLQILANDQMESLR